MVRGALTRLLVTVQRHELPAASWLGAQKLPGNASMRHFPLCDLPMTVASITAWQRDSCTVDCRRDRRRTLLFCRYENGERYFRAPGGPRRQVRFVRSTTGNGALVHASGASTQLVDFRSPVYGPRDRPTRTPSCSADTGALRRSGRCRTSRSAGCGNACRSPSSGRSACRSARPPRCNTLRMTQMHGLRAAPDPLSRISPPLYQRWPAAMMLPCWGQTAFEQPFSQYHEHERLSTTTKPPCGRLMHRSQKVSLFLSESLIRCR